MLIRPSRFKCCLFSVFAAAFPLTSFSQATPPIPGYTAGGKLANTTDYSPALIQFNHELVMVYPNRADHNYLYAARSNGQLGFENPGARISTVPVTSAASIALFNGSLFTVFNSNGVIYVASSMDGVTWTGASGALNYNPPNIPASSKPGLAAYGYNLVLAFVTGTNVATAYSPTGYGYTTNAATLPNTATSAPALATYNNQLYAVYTVNSSHNPYLCGGFNSMNGAFQGTCNADTAFQIGNDPALFVYNNALYIGGKSNYSEDEFWTTGTYDGLNFTPAYKYGQTLTQSPAVSVLGTELYECAKSKNGSNIWCYYN